MDLSHGGGTAHIGGNVAWERAFRATGPVRGRSTPAFGSWYVPRMRGSGRQTRLANVRDTPAGWIRLVRCVACGHQASLPVDALIARYGELQPLEFVLQRLSCTRCSGREVEYRLARLCDPGCGKQRG